MTANNLMLNEPDLEGEDSDQAVDAREEIDVGAVVEYPMIYPMNQSDETCRLLQNLELTTRPTLIFIDNDADETIGWANDELPDYDEYYTPGEFHVTEEEGLAAINSYYAMIKAEEDGTSEDENEENDAVESSSEEESDDEDSIEVYLYPFGKPDVIA